MGHQDVPVDPIEAPLKLLLATVMRQNNSYYR